MKFLVISRPRANTQGLTSAMVEAYKEIVNRYLKSGIDDCLFAIADGRGGTCGIMNADSGEALVELLQDVPAISFLGRLRKNSAATRFGASTVKQKMC